MESIVIHVIKDLLRTFMMFKTELPIATNHTSIYQLTTLNMESDL